ncbi:MAG: pyruvate kinase [Candidatus Paceibacterota bacterium]|jgi:pyruvate kinase
MDPRIIATIGPASDNYKILKDMVETGMRIARINFSHGTYEQWNRVKSYLAKIKEESGIDVKMMMDLQGPRIRIGILSRNGIIIKEGEIYSFIYGSADIKKNEIPIDNASLYKDMKIGEPFYLANGMIELEVSEIKNKKIIARAIRGGHLLSRKGINIPVTNLSSNVITAKDKADAIFGAENGADYICLSFVQTGKDIRQLKKIIKNKNIKIIAKIERGTALIDIDNIAKYSDGLMVARGDLGIEVPIEELPIIQKELIRRAHWYKKPAIVATEMLASMIDKPRPTRAEIADIANAIFSGADAVMLSDETASGMYPIEAVATMRKIAKRADEYYNGTNYLNNK